MLLKDAYCNHICIFLRENLQKKSMPPPHKDSVRDRFFTIHDSPCFREGILKLPESDTK